MRGGELLLCKYWDQAGWAAWLFNFKVYKQNKEQQYFILFFFLSPAKQWLLQYLDQSRQTICLPLGTIAFEQQWKRDLAFQNQTKSSPIQKMSRHILKLAKYPFYNEGSVDWSRTSKQKNCLRNHFKTTVSWNWYSLLHRIYCNTCNFVNPLHWNIAYSAKRIEFSTTKKWNSYPAIQTRP